MDYIEHIELEIIKCHLHEWMIVESTVPDLILHVHGILFDTRVPRKQSLSKIRQKSRQGLAALATVVHTCNNDGLQKGKQVEFDKYMMSQEIIKKSSRNHQEIIKKSSPLQAPGIEELQL